MWDKPVQQLHIRLVKLMVKHATLFHCFLLLFSSCTAALFIKKCCPYFRSLET